MRISVDIISDKLPPFRCNPAELVETLLSETAMSFSHQLDLHYDRIGTASKEKYGTALTQNTVERMQSIGKAFVLSRDALLLEELMDADSAFLETVRIDTYGSLGEEKHSWNRVEIVRSLETDALQASMNQIAQDQPCGPCISVTPNGKKEVWEKAFQDPEHKILFMEKAAKDAIVHLIQNRDFGTIVLPPYAGGIFASAARALHFPGFARTVSYGQSCMFIPSIETADETAALISVILSMSDYLETVCGLTKEAFCIRTGLLAILPAEMENNAPDCEKTDPAKMTDMVIQQIRFAGQLMNR